VVTEKMYIFCLRNEKNVRTPKVFGAIQVAFHMWTEVSLSMQPTDTVFGLTLGFLTLSIMRPPRSKTSPPVAQPVQASILSLDTPLLEALAREVAEALRQKNAANKVTTENRCGLSIQ
jgi:hypothetical protein